MIKEVILILGVLSLSACTVDETISKFVDVTAEYVLIEMNGQPVATSASIAFPEPGKVAGQAPCNRYFATQSAIYPWFALEGIGATRLACPNLAAESTFFAALEDMTLAEVSGDTLILSNTVGRQMVFVAR
ncbi:MAG: META domain-containing protein [Octadecabacter sp.]